MNINKNKIANGLIELIADGYQGTQIDIVNDMQSRGFSINQSTVSKYLSKIGVIKYTNAKGSYYRIDLQNIKKNKVSKSININALVNKEACHNSNIKIKVNNGSMSEFVKKIKLALMIMFL